MKVVIIGAGIGGIALANLLAKDGHEVHIYEKNAVLGGRAGLLKQDGFTFDTGPSWYLMPEVFERYYRLLDLDVDRELQLQRLDPAYKVFFEHERPLTITSDITKDSATFESIEQGAGAQLRRYVARGEKIYRLSLDHFLYSSFTTIRDIFKPALLRHALTMVGLAFTPLHRYVNRYVNDLRLQQILEYPMVFLGTSPFKAPSIYSLMSALDFQSGVYYPRGGIYTIIESLVSYGKTHAVRFHTGHSVQTIRTESSHTGFEHATGVILDDSTFVTADIVISNADLHHTETKLLASHVQSYPEAYWQRREPGPSALLMYFGIKGELPALNHHNLLFVDRWHENFKAIEDQQLPPDPASIYICKPSATDRSVAPEGHENVFVLVPLPPGDAATHYDIPNLQHRYLTQIKRMTRVNLTSGVVTQHVVAPRDFVQHYNAWNASMLGQSHKLTQSAFFRTKNKSKRVDNLYYVGANTLPGIGLPMCLISAELTAARIKQDWSHAL